MLLIECSKIKKYFGDRLVLEVEDLKIYSEDRIGIVGVNGAGKTTLMNILSERVEPDEGWINRYSKYAYITQLEDPKNEKIDSEMASKFGVPSVWNVHMSGGEKTRFKLAESFSEHSPLIFADEPTSNVDMEGIELMEKMFEEYKGALLVISHDRNFLDKLCNKIMEVEQGKIKIYNGNYSDYRIQKAKEKERALFEYEQYIKEKKRLEAVMDQTREKVKTMRKTPKRMGNSEARLHKMGNQKAKANLDKAVKSIESRVMHLEVKERPKEPESIKLEVSASSKLYGKMIIEGSNIHKVFDRKIIFQDASFNIYNSSKVALVGPNGCGKSTLIKMIMDLEDGIKTAQGAKIGYFTQDMHILEENNSIIENVMETSIYTETFARILLARLLFKREDIFKKVGVLSGGERVKVSFAKILLQDINLLILDEPTNYMDIDALEVVEEALRAYDRTLLFVSHDRRFVSVIADHIMTIENHQIKMFQGTYEEYLEKRNRSVDPCREDIEKQVFLLENRLSEVLGRLSVPSKKDDPVALDKEYHEILGRLKDLKTKL